MAKAAEKYIEPEKVNFADPVIGSYKSYDRKESYPIPDTRLSEAYAYFGQKYSFEDGLKWLVEYMEHNHYSKEDINKAKRAEQTVFSMVTCTQARLMTHGCSLPLDSVIRFENKIIEGLAQGTSLINQSTQTNKPSVQDYIAKQAGKYIAEIEGQLDDHHFDFETYKYLSDKQISAIAAGHIKKWFLRQYDELFQAYNKMDDMLVEGYSHLKGNTLLERQLFVKRIVDDCERWASNKKTVRKPRAKKERSASSQLAKIKYQREYPELKILSINPEAMIGAYQVWLYNTKDRKLSVYNSTKLGGISIKGTTLQGFSEEFSEVKKIRKPEVILPRVLDGGKVVLKHLMSDIKAKAQKATGRINGFTILLRAVK